MELTEAMRLLNVSSLTAEGIDKTIKGNYRKLMKRYHPDVYTGDDGDTAKKITEAYKLLKEIANKYSEITNRDIGSGAKVDTIVLDLNQLRKLYTEKVQRGKVGSKEVELTINKLGKMNSFILCTAKVLHNGFQKEFTEFNRYNVYGNYQITCCIEVADLTSEEEIQLTILDKTRKISVKAQSLKFIMTVDSNIKVEVVINKKKI